MGPTIQSVRLEDPDFYFEGRRESYQRLQAECPVYYYEPLDLFVLTKHEDIREAARRPEIFSSSRGLHLHQLRLTPSEVEAYATLYAGGEQFAFADPPRHRELRGVATRAFAPRPLARLTDQVRRDVAELTGRIEPGQSLDFVDEVAAVLPIRVAAAFIGLPSGHDADIRRWSDALEAMKLVRGADNIRATVRQFAEMNEFFLAQFTVKRANPGDDLISTLLAAQLDGKPLSEPDLLTYCSTFLAAGSDTTRSLIAGMALALAEHPDQLSKLKANPDLLDGAIEESLRWTTPARGFLRTALVDTRSAASTSRPASGSTCSTTRATGTRRSSRTRGPTTSSGRMPTPISGSATVRTCASPPTSPGSRRASYTARCWIRSTRSRSRVRSSRSGSCCATAGSTCR